MSADQNLAHDAEPTRDKPVVTLVLAGALGLAGPVREVFVAAARGKAGADEVLAARHGVVPGPFAATATRALLRDIAVFTGRQAELAQLVGAVAAGGEVVVVGIYAIDGMAGVGKTTFAVRAAYQAATATKPARPRTESMG
jgi:hypothetical protein